MRPTRISLFALALALACSPLAHAQRDLKNIPDPDPEEERKTFILPEGFEVNLYAADPLLAKPIQMNFGADGRLWIASSEVYPQIKPGQEATDKILVLSDDNHDGRADKTTVFTSDLLVPTGVLPGNGGCYVANSTELIFLKDTDGDGKADLRRTVLSGFGTEDTHHLLHTLRWGHDGQMYMNQSIYIHSHVETPYGVKRLNAGGIWAFRPETLELDVLCRGFVNPWGHHFDYWGSNFATDGAYGEGINYVFPGAVYVTAADAKRTVAGLNPGSPKHCSLEILSGRHLPPEWNGNMITNDFRAHRVCRFVVTEDNSGYASRQEVEVIKSAHPAFRPIDAKVGPDGALYIADWYNPIIQHGEVDFRDPRRDHTHGRIWRVTAKGRPLVTPPQFAGKSPAELLALTQLPEEFARLHAKLELKEQGAEKVLPALKSHLAALDVGSPNFEHDRLECLWVYQTLNVVEPDLLRLLLKSKDYHVRAAAMRVASQWREKLPDAPALYEAGANDEHPRVRLEAVRALAETKSVDAAVIALRALDKPMDRFLDFALWQTMRDLEPQWLPALREGKLDFGGDVKKLSFALQSVDSPGVVEPLIKMVKGDNLPPERLLSLLTLVSQLGGPGDLSVALDFAANDKPTLNPAQKAAILANLVETSQRRKLAPAGDLSRLKALFASPDAGLASAALRAAGAWKVEPLRADITALTTQADALPPVRQGAIAALGLLGGPASKAALISLADAKQPLDSRKFAVAALADVDAKASAEQLVVLLATLPDKEDPAPLVAALVQRKGGPELFATALAGKKVPADVAKLTLRAVQSSLQAPPALVEAVRTAGGLSQGGWKMSPEEVQKFVGEVAQADPARGEAQFRRKELNCQKCHAIGGAGGRVGPDLVSIGASAPVDYIIYSLLEPNQKVKEGFHSKVVITGDGKQLTGIVVRENDKEVVIRDAEDRELTLPRSNVESIVDGRSLMPDGAVDLQTRGELADLARFLSELGKIGPYALGQARVVRRWQAVIPTAAAYNFLSKTSYDSVAAGDATYTWEPAYSRVSGELPLDELPWLKAPLRSVPNPDEKVSFIRTEIEVTTPGEVGLKFSGINGLTGFIDGKTTELKPELTVNLAKGRHNLTLAIQHWQRKEPLRVELTTVANSPAQAELVSGK